MTLFVFVVSRKLLMIIFQKYKELCFLIYFLAISTRTKVHLDYPAAIYSKDIFFSFYFSKFKGFLYFFFV